MCLAKLWLSPQTEGAGCVRLQMSGLAGLVMDGRQRKFITHDDLSLLGRRKPAVPLEIGLNHMVRPVCGKYT